MEAYLRTLVQFPTVTGNFKANNQALDYVQAFFAQRGLFVARFDFDGFGAMVATTREGSKTPRVMLGAHLDVVPAPEEFFALRLDGDTYTGRGCFDMKFAIAVYMQLIEDLHDELAAYDLGIMITTDEEAGGERGVKRLIELGYRPDVCILPDAGPEWQIETLAKGLVYATIETHGTTGHGSRPWLADSASFKLIDLLAEVKAVFHEQKPETSTLNISRLESGKALTQIPDHAKAGLDIRFPSVAEYHAIHARLEQLCAEFGATYTEQLYGAPCINALDDPLIAPFAAIMAEETGIPAKGEVSYGATDARYFAEINVPCIMARPTAGGHHGSDEWISKAGIATYHTILRRYIERMARP